MCFQAPSENRVMSLCEVISLFNVHESSVHLLTDRNLEESNFQINARFNL